MECGNTKKKKLYTGTENAKAKLRNVGMQEAKAFQEHMPIWVHYVVQEQMVFTLPHGGEG